ncbi:aldo/keto reductase [bacterium]|nr:aldo/keto reductase [bacterium]
MHYRKLGKTGIEVSTVAFGAWAIAGGFTWGDQDQADSRAALRAAYDAGVTFYDTAEAYGSGWSEELIGQTLADVRDNIVIASKLSPAHAAPADLRRAVEGSLNRLRTDRIDLYQVHWPNRAVPFGDTLAALDELRQQGKIRAYGVSNFGPHDLGTCLALGHPVTSDQVAYSLLFRAVEHELQPRCVREQVSILCYSPLLQGLLTGKFASPDDVPADRARTRHFAASRPHSQHGEPGAEPQTWAAIGRIRQIAAELGEPMADIAVAWLLAQPGVTATIVGARNADQARRNVRAADLVLEPGVLQRLAEATDPLKQILGGNLDLWLGASRLR